MYRDYVLVLFDNDDVHVCIAPRWSGLSEGELVKVEGRNDLGKVQSCITVSSKDEDLIAFITYLADEIPTLKVLSTFTEKRMDYESV